MFMCTFLTDDSHLREALWLTPVNGNVWILVGKRIIYYHSLYESFIFNLWTTWL